MSKKSTEPKVNPEVELQVEPEVEPEAPKSEAPKSEEPKKLANGDRVVILAGNSFIAGRRVMGESEVVEVGKDMPLDVAVALLDSGKVRWA